MSFGSRTPECLLKRADSKNPATTCRGLTANGRPCRRALAGSPANSPRASPSRGRQHDGVFAVLDVGEATAYFCWQHKNQAEILVSQSFKRSQAISLKHKSSIDTLIARVGLLDLEHDSPEPSEQGQQRYTDGSIQRRARRKETLPKPWQQLQGPLMSVPEEAITVQTHAQTQKSQGFSEPKGQTYYHTSQPTSTRRTGRSNVKTSWSCCIRADDNDDDERFSSARRVERQSTARATSSHYRNQGSRLVASSRPVRAEKARPPLKSPTCRPSMRQRPASSPFTTPQTISSSQRPPLRATVSSPADSQTSSLLSLIPLHLSPSTTAALLSELSKPISEADEEGYIYIFWLTPESEPSKPDDETASTLLDEEEDEEGEEDYDRSIYQNNFVDRGTNPQLVLQRERRRKRQQRHREREKTAHVALNRYASTSIPGTATTTTTKKSQFNYTETKKSSSESASASLPAPSKILLKIGRAANVHRRLSQWTRQCGQNITLIRYYPYFPSTSRVGDASEHQAHSSKCPHVHRVERLIHLELADKRFVAVEGRGKEQAGKEEDDEDEEEEERGKDGQEARNEGCCVRCGRVHKEWFAVDATRKGVREVDEVVRRWVGWAEGIARRQ